MPDPNATFNQALSTAAYRYITSGELPDQIFEGLRLFSVLKKKGAIEEIDGGYEIVVPIEYARNAFVKWMAEYEQYDLAATPIINAANFGWKLIGGPVIVTDEELMKNKGRTQQVNLAKAKLNNLVHTLQDKFNLALFSDGTDTKQPAGLEAIVATTGTYGGINRATAGNEFWKANVTAVGGALTAAAMVTMYNTCTHNRWSPNMICTTMTQYGKYEGLAQAVQHIYKNTEGDVGFDHLTFKGVPLFWDHNVASGIMYFLTSGPDSQFLKVYCHEDAMFKMDEPIRSPNQNLTVHKCKWFGNFVCCMPRTQGKLTGLT